MHTQILRLNDFCKIVWKPLHFAIGYLQVLGVSPLLFHKAAAHDFVIADDFHKIKTGFNIGFYLYT